GRGGKKQVCGVRPLQLPLRQVALTRQRSVGVQKVPFIDGTNEQLWLASLNCTCWQGLWAKPQSLAGPPMQSPMPLQVSAVVQNMPSSQGTPASSSTTTQLPTGP